jgi:hypothetical protein
MGKKGLSPVISAVILIGIGVILAAIIFVWARGFIIGLGPSDLSCEGVNFDAGIFCGGGECVLEAVNLGNVVLNGFVIKSIEEGSVFVRDNIKYKVDFGESTSTLLNSLNEKDKGKEVLIVPIILAEIADGQAEHICSDRYGVGAIVG